MRACNEAGVSLGKIGTAAWIKIGPLSTSKRARWTVQPVSLTPAAKACSTARTPRKAGEQAGMNIQNAIGESFQQNGCNNPHPASHNDPFDTKLIKSFNNSLIQSLT